MKKAVLKDTVDEAKIKPHNGMKLFSALAIILPTFLDAGQKAHAMVHVTRIPKTTIVKDMASKQNSFAIVRTPKGGSEQVHNGWHSTIDGSRFYCLQPMNITPGVGHKSTYSHQDNGDVRAVLRAGYGMNTAAQLGHPGHAAECEYATQVAVWRTAGVITSHITWKNAIAHEVYNHIMKVYKEPKYRGDGLTNLYFSDLTPKRAKASGKTIQKVKNNQATATINLFDFNSNAHAATVKANKAKPKKAKKTIETQTLKIKQPVNKAKSANKASVKKKAAPFKGAPKRAKGKISTKTTKKTKSTTITGSNGKTKILEIVASENHRPSNLNIKISSSNLNIKQNGKKVTNSLRSNTKFTATLKPGAKTGSITARTTGYRTVAAVYDPGKGLQRGVTLLGVKDKKLVATYKWGQNTPKPDITTTPDTFTPELTAAFATTPAGQDTPDTSSTPAKPTVKSNATNALDGKKVITNSTGSAEINEQVIMTGLSAGQTYKINSWLVDAQTKKPIQINGQGVANTTTYTPANSGKSTTNVKIKVPSVSSLAKKSVVVYTDVTSQKDPKNVIKHEDPNDKDETVLFSSPSLKTTATNTQNGGKQLLPVNLSDITDNVNYSDVIPGEKYVIRGVLMDQTTNKPVVVNGIKVQSSTTFTAEKANGSVKVPFQFDASNYQGKRLVVFETLYSGNNKIAEHKNINDVSQSIDVTKPAIKTTLTGNEQKIISPKSNNVVNDNVQFNGIIPGLTYTMKGKLIDTTTGKPVTNNGKPVITTTTFKPTKSNGNLIIPFKFNGQNYAGHSIVAVETLSEDQSIIARHENLKDTSQTISLSHMLSAPIKTSASNTTTPKSNSQMSVLPQTGDENDNLSKIIFTVISVIIIGSLVLYVRRSQTTGLE